MFMNMEPRIERMSRKVMQGLAPGDMIVPWLNVESARSLAIHGRLPRGGNKGDVMLLTVVGQADMSDSAPWVAVATIDPMHSAVRIIHSAPREIHSAVLYYVVVWSAVNVSGMMEEKE